jgi:uncharacterized protein YjiS (DUF1127 family)
MKEASVQHRDYRLSSLDRRGDQRRKAARPPRAVWDSCVRNFDRAAQHGSPLWMSPGVQLTRRMPRRVTTGHIAPLTTLRRIFAIIRLWCGRARSRHQLRELDDHMLKDIGLRREDVGYECAMPLWHWDGSP